MQFLLILNYKSLIEIFFQTLYSGPKDVVMTLGQDGLVVNTAKYLNGQPIIAVNGADLVAGEISEQNKITLESHMPEAGVIFSDGMESDFLEFNSGTTASIGLAEKMTRLVVKE
jgi:hypothetical protein